MKRKTKSEKEAEEKAALRQRIADVYAGACGEPADTDDFFLTLEAGSRAITALKKLFGQEGRVACWLLQRRQHEVYKRGMVGIWRPGR